MRTPDEKLEQKWAGPFSDGFIIITKPPYPAGLRRVEKRENFPSIEKKRPSVRSLAYMPYPDLKTEYPTTADSDYGIPSASGLGFPHREY